MALKINLQNCLYFRGEQIETQGLSIFPRALSGPFTLLPLPRELLSGAIDPDPHLPRNQAFDLISHWKGSSE